MHIASTTEEGRENFAVNVKESYVSDHQDAGRVVTSLLSTHNIASDGTSHVGPPDFDPSYSTQILSAERFVRNIASYLSKTGPAENSAMSWTT